MKTTDTQKFRQAFIQIFGAIKQNTKIFVCVDVTLCNLSRGECKTKSGEKKSFIPPLSRHDLLHLFMLNTTQ